MREEGRSEGEEGKGKEGGREEREEGVKRKTN